MDKWIEALTEMVGDEDQEDFYESPVEAKDFRKARDNERSGREDEDQDFSSGSDDEPAPEDECETPPEESNALPNWNDPKVPQENEKYFEKKNYVRTDKYDLGLLQKLMSGLGLPPIAQLFEDIK